MGPLPPHPARVLTAKEAEKMLSLRWELRWGNNSCFGDPLQFFNPGPKQATDSLLPCMAAPIYLLWQELQERKEESLIFSFVLCFRFALYDYAEIIVLQSESRQAPVRQQDEHSAEALSKGFCDSLQKKTVRL
jgi:hypothetical protein